MRHGVVPNLAPHVRTAASGTIEAVLRREGTEVKAKPVGLLEHRNVDRLRRRGLREHEEHVAVVRGAALRVGRDVLRVRLEMNGRGGRRCGKGNVGPKWVRLDMGQYAGLTFEYILQPVEVSRKRLALRVWNVKVNHQESVQTCVRVEQRRVDLRRSSRL